MINVVILLVMVKDVVVIIVLANLAKNAVVVLVGLFQPAPIVVSRTLAKIVQIVVTLNHTNAQKGSVANLRVGVVVMVVVTPPNAVLATVLMASFV
jgi:hypothetical protein